MVRRVYAFDRASRRTPRSAPHTLEGRMNRIAWITVVMPLRLRCRQAPVRFGKDEAAVLRALCARAIASNRSLSEQVKSFGFRTFHAVELALYHTLGALPEPEAPHRFY